MTSKKNEINFKGESQYKSGNNSSNTSKVSADNTVASDNELNPMYLNQESEGSEDEMRSTDGEESDPNSPLASGSQYLN